MTDEQKAKLIEAYWEAYEKATNHRRGKWEDNREYYDGFYSGMEAVFETIGIDPDIGMPEHIRLEREENSKVVRAMYAEMGLTYDDLRKPVEPIGD